MKGLNKGTTSLVLIMFIIGLIYGRNFEAVNAKTKQDITEIYQAINRSTLSQIAYSQMERLCRRADKRLRHKLDKRLGKHTLICECRKCTPSFRTYIRKLKAVR